MRIGARLVALYFTEQDQRDIAYLALLQDAGLLFDAGHVNGEHLRFIGEFRDMDVLDDYVFPKEQNLLRKDADGKVLLTTDPHSGKNTHPVASTLAVGNGEIRAAGPLDARRPADFGDLYGGIDQVEVLAADAYGSQRIVVFSGYQPDNKEEIEQRVWSALEGREVEF